MKRHDTPIIHLCHTADTPTLHRTNTKGERQLFLFPHASSTAGLPRCLACCHALSFRLLSLAHPERNPCRAFIFKRNFIIMSLGSLALRMLSTKASYITQSSYIRLVGSLAVPPPSPFSPQPLALPPFGNPNPLFAGRGPRAPLPSDIRCRHRTPDFTPGGNLRGMGLAYSGFKA